ncbi:hypothetical protein B7463_g3305, partial [Scytalidium lignicola]
MPITTPPLDFEHKSGDEVPTKHKEAIRQLYNFAKIPISILERRYNLGNSTIRRILSYTAPERTRITRTSRPSSLTNKQMDEIIEYLSESWEHRKLDYALLRDELELTCSVKTLEKKLKQQGYFRCVACQKPFLTTAQVLARSL